MQVSWCWKRVVKTCEHANARHIPGGDLGMVLLRRRTQGDQQQAIKEASATQTKSPRRRRDYWTLEDILGSCKMDADRKPLGRHCSVGIHGPLSEDECLARPSEATPYKSIPNITTSAGPKALNRAMASEICSILGYVYMNGRIMLKRLADCIVHHHMFPGNLQAGVLEKGTMTGSSFPLRSIVADQT